jgi:hypothetical protein
MRGLNDLVVENPEVTFVYPTAVNERGQIAVDGLTHAYRLTPVPEERR